MLERFFLKAVDLSTETGGVTDLSVQSMKRTAGGYENYRKAKPTAEKISLVSSFNEKL